MKHKKPEPTYIDIEELLESLKKDVPRYSCFAWIGIPDESYIIELKAKGKERSLTYWLKLQQDTDGNYQVILDVPNEQEKLIWSKDPLQEKKPDIQNEDSKIKAFIIADEYIIDNFYDNVNLLLLNALWREDPASEKQIAFIRSYNLYPEEGLTKGEAFMIIGLINYLKIKTASASKGEK